MIHQRWLWLFLLGLGAVTAIPSLVRAQEDEISEQKRSQSHNLADDKFGLPRGDTEELFKERLKQIRDEQGLDFLKNNGLSQKQLDDFLNKHPDFLKKFDPQSLPPDVQKMIQGREAELKAKMESLNTEEIRRAMAMAQGRRFPTMPPGSGAAATVPEALGKSGPGPRISRVIPATPPDPSSETGSTPPDPNMGDRQADPSFTQRVLEVADRIDPSLRHSRALQRAISDLRESFGEDDPRWQKMTSGANAVKEKWSRWTESIHAERFVPEKDISWPKSLTPSWRPQVRWPGALPASGRSSSANSARGSATNATSETQSWQIVLGVLGLILLGFALWKVRARSPSNAAQGATAVWKLGPWPVDPAAVLTREEFIQAFEYLSVLRLGPEARNWNHRVIACGLGGESPSPAGYFGSSDNLLKVVATYDPGEWRRVADQLAALYERARYAPPDDPLPDGALVAARRHLCFLAGVSAA